MSSSGASRGSGGTPPSYGTSSGLSYLASRNVANYLPARALKTRAALARSAAGGRGDFVFIGDSAQAGFNGNGNAQDTEQAFPAQLQKFLVQNGAGIVDGGTGARPAAMSLGLATAGWTFTGGVTNNSGPFLFTNAAGTATYVSPKVVGGAGTAKITVTYHGQSVNFSFTVGGGAANNIVPSGQARWEQFVLAGQTVNAGTAIVFTFTGLNELVGLEISGPSGIVCHNLGYGGARLNSGANPFNWSLSAITSLAPPRYAMLPATVDAVVIQLLANDAASAADPATIIPGFAGIFGQSWAAGADRYIAMSWHQPTTSDATWNSYLTQAYLAAAQLGAVLLDWNDRVGGQAAAQANGMLGPDNTHGTYATYGNFGKAIGDLLLD